MKPTPSSSAGTRSTPPERELLAKVAAGCVGVERKARFRWRDRETGARMLVEVGGDEDFLRALEACGFERLVAEVPATNTVQTAPRDPQGMEGSMLEAGGAVRSKRAGDPASPWGEIAPEGEGWISPRRGQSEGRGQARRKGA